jgi:phosphopantothenoylcysteine decarboxylase
VKHVSATDLQVVPPVTKRLACGDVGSGAMASPEDIAATCQQALLGAGFRFG